MVIVTQEYGKENGFTYIFEKSESALIFADEATDITEKILKIYDQKHLEKKKGSK